MNRLKLNIQMFAIEGNSYVDLATYSGTQNAYRLSANYIENSTSITDNTSNMTFTATLETGVNKVWSTWSSSQYSKMSIYWWDNRTNTETLIDEYSFNHLLASDNNKQQLQVTKNIKHNEDGTLNGYMKVVFDKGTSTYQTICRSGETKTSTKALTTIARKSNLYDFSGYVDNPITIKWTASSTSFTYTLRYTFGSLNNQTIASNIRPTTTNTDGTNYTWIMPTSFYSQIGANSKQKTGTIYLDTYNGTSLVGTSSATFTAVCLESKCKPTASINVVDINSLTTNLTGNNKTLIKGYTTARATITRNVLNGANLVSVTINGKEIGTTATTYDIYNATSITYTSIVTDSRGFATIVSDNFSNELDYIPITISGRAKRTDGISGNVKIEYSGNYWNKNFGRENNTISLQYRYKKVAEQDYSNWIEINNYSLIGNSYNGNFIISNMDIKSAYNFQFRAIDKLDTSNISSSDIPKGTPIFWFNNDTAKVNGNFYSDNLGYALIDNNTNIDEIVTTKQVMIFNAKGTLPAGYSTSDNNIILESTMPTWTTDFGRQVLKDIRTNKTYQRNRYSGQWHNWEEIMTNKGLIQNKSFNELINDGTGLFDILPTADAPNNENGYYHVMQIKSDSLWAYQEATLWWGDKYIRTKQNGIWSEWQTILTNKSYFLELWTNQSPTSNFGEKTLTIDDLKQCRFIEIYYVTDTTASRMAPPCKIFGGVQCDMFLPTTNTSAQASNYARGVKWDTTNNTIKFNMARKENVGYYDDKIIPYKIIGYR